MRQGGPPVHLRPQRQGTVLLDSIQAVDGSKVRLRGSLAPQGAGPARRLLAVSPPPGAKDGLILPAGFALDVFVDGSAEVQTRPQP